MDTHVVPATPDATLPVPDGGPVDHQQPGRRCAHPGCATRLSRYNPDSTCTAHGGWSDATVKRPGRKPRRDR